MVIKKDNLNKENVMGAERENTSGNQVDTNYSCQTGSYYRPYSEELWTGLVMLRNMVAAAGIRLAKMLSDNEGLDFIAKGPTLQMLVGGRDSE